MALKVKNPKKNLADILIEKERLNESYDSSSAVSLKTLEETAEEEGTVEKTLKQTTDGREIQAKDANRPNESMVNESAEIPVNNGMAAQTYGSTAIESLNPASSAEVPQPKQVQHPQQVQQPQQIIQAQQIPQDMNQGSVQAANPMQAFIAPQTVAPEPVMTSSQPFIQGGPAVNAPNIPQTGMPGINPMANQFRKPWEEVEDYNPPRKKRGRPYQGYSENTHVQSIYVRNDLYEYIMINYVGHGRKHQSFNKFVNAAINNYLRQLDEG